jgi:Zn-dependent protease/CBS domain-containing protein
MKRFRVGSPFGIPLQIDVTFLLVLPLFAYVISSRIGEMSRLFETYLNASIDVAALSGGNTQLLIGLTGALWIFGSIFFHELGHSMVAREYGYRIQSITLWVFGGLAALETTPSDWEEELYIALAGPAASLVFGAVCYVAYTLAPIFLWPIEGVIPHVSYLLLYLSLMNLALAVTNMIPAFPMDGGRVLRALLARNRSFGEATEVAAELGQAVAVFLGVVGLVRFDFIMAGVALFVYLTASNESEQAMLRTTFEGVTVGDVMTPTDQLLSVTPETSVAQLLSLPVDAHRSGIPVINRGHPVGTVSVDDARQVEQSQRQAVPVRELSTDDVVTVTRQASAMDAISVLKSRDVDHLFVIDRRGIVIGTISRTDLAVALDKLTAEQPAKTANHTATGQEPI